MVNVEELFEQLDDELEQVDKLDLYGYLQSIYPTKVSRDTVGKLITKSYKDVVLELCLKHGFIIERNKQGKLYLIRAEGELVWNKVKDNSKVKLGKNLTPATIPDYLKSLERCHREKTQRTKEQLEKYSSNSSTNNSGSV